MLSTILFWDLSALYLMLSTILFWECISSLPDVVYNTILGVYQTSTWCCQQYYSGIVSDLYLMLSTILVWDCVRSLASVVNYTIMGFIRSPIDVVNNTIMGLYQISTWCCLQYYSGIVSDLYLMLSTILFWECIRPLPDVVNNTSLGLCQISSWCCQ